MEPANDPDLRVPLCVDLDGTLIRTDVTWQSFLLLLRRRPLSALVVPVWLLRGRANLKTQLVRRVQVDPAGLPYNQEFLQFLREEKRRGRTLFLVTAADVRMATLVADHVGLFAEVLASDGQTNLRGRAKGARLAERFGERQFDYAGNSRVDLPVWRRARQAIVVNASRGLAEKAGQVTTLGRVFS